MDRWNKRLYRWIFIAFISVVMMRVIVLQIKYINGIGNNDIDIGTNSTETEDVKFSCEQQQQQQQHHSQKQKEESEQEDPSHPGRKRIALVMFGILNHYHPHWPDYIPPPHNVSLYASFGSIQEHVIRPAQENGYVVDIFAHSWNWEERHLICTVYQQPTASQFEPANERDMFDSIEAGLKLRRKFEKQASVTYDWVFIMRHDIYFLNTYNVNELNADLFYVSNWCVNQTSLIDGERLRKQWGTEHGTEHCDAIEVFEHDGFRSVPDMLFVGSPQNVDLVFMDLKQDFNHGAFELGTSCCGHAKSGGRIFSLHDAGLLKIGRYKVHFMDYTYLRFLSKTQPVLAKRSVGLWLHPNQYDSTIEHVQSQCSPTAHYCYNESYGTW